jgi:hypothetical protein
VLRPRRLRFAEIVIGTELSEDARNIDLWAGESPALCRLQSGPLVPMRTATLRRVEFDSFSARAKLLPEVVMGVFARAGSTAAQR